MTGAADWRASRVAVTLACLAAVVAIALGDAATTPVIRFGALYLLTVLTAALWGVPGAGLFMTVASTIADLLVSWSLGAPLDLALGRALSQFGVCLVGLWLVKRSLFQSESLAALRLYQSRADRQRLAVLEDRQRLARDLHDTVVQDLIAIGMQLDSQGREITDPRLRSRQASTVTQLIETVQRLRSLAFDLRVPSVEDTTSATLRKIVEDAASAMGHVPRLVVDGAVDLLPDAVASSMTAVVREALSNVARHSRATRTTVGVVLADECLTVSVEDNGVGPSRVACEGEGTHNMRRRATELSGTVRIAPVSPHGTRVVWQVPVPVADAAPQAR